MENVQKHGPMRHAKPFITKPHNTNTTNNNNNNNYTSLVKAVQLEVRSGPDGSRKLRFPDYMTTAQDGGKVVSLTHRPPLPPGHIIYEPKIFSTDTES